MADYPDWSGVEGAIGSAPAGAGYANPISKLMTRISNPALAAQQSQQDMPTIAPTKSGGSEVDAPTSSSVSTNAPPPKPAAYDPTQAWAWRARLAAGGKPGEQVVNDYGPAFGNARVMATADKNGRFNSFGDAPSVPGSMPAPPTSMFEQQMNGLRQQIAAARAQGGLAGSLRAVGLQRQLNALQLQGPQYGQVGVGQAMVGVQQGHLALQDRNTYSDAALAAARNKALEAGGPGAMQELVASQHGSPNLLTLPGIGVTTLLRPSAVGPNGLRVPTFMNPGQQPTMADMPQMPYLRTNQNSEGY